MKNRVENTAQRLKPMIETDNAGAQPFSASRKLDLEIKDRNFCQLILCCGELAPFARQFVGLVIAMIPATCKRDK